MIPPIDPPPLSEECPVCSLKLRAECCYHGPCTEHGSERGQCCPCCDCGYNMAAPTSDEIGAAR